MNVRITYLPDEQTEERRVFILENQGSGATEHVLTEITNQAYLDHDGEGAEIVVSQREDGALTLRTETWYCPKGYCEITMNVICLEGALRCFVALVDQADQEEWTTS